MNIKATLPESNYYICSFCISVIGSEVASRNATKPTRAKDTRSKEQGDAGKDAAGSSGTASGTGGARGGRAEGDGESFEVGIQ